MPPCNRILEATTTRRTREIKNKMRTCVARREKPESDRLPPYSYFIVIHRQAPVRTTRIRVARLGAGRCRVLPVRSEVCLVGPAPHRSTSCSSPQPHSHSRRVSHSHRITPIKDHVAPPARVKGSATSSAEPAPPCRPPPKCASPPYALSPSVDRVKPGPLGAVYPSAVSQVRCATTVQEICSGARTYRPPPPGPVH